MICRLISVVLSLSLLWSPTPAFASDISALRVAAFNIQVFGGSKMSETEVVAVLVKIIRRYDLILIQEIRDSSQTAIFSLLAEVNHGLPHKYDSVVSTRLGRSTSKEQYAYLYRNDRINYVTSYVYPDPSDVFEREPYVGVFTWGQLDFFCVGIHTSPGKAETEIGHLVDVYDHARRKLGITDALILGDFNAGCSYVTKTEWKKVKLATDPRFYWLIGNEMDTTSGNSNCPYDRFVVAGSRLAKAVIPLSPHAFDYAKIYNLNNSMALKVSDHYPVEMTLEQPAANFPDQKSLTVYHPSSGHISRSKIYALRRDALGLSAYALHSVHTSTGGYSLIAVSLSATGQRQLVTKVLQMKKDFPGFIAQSQVDSIVWRATEMRTYRALSSGDGRFRTLKDFYQELTANYKVSLKCSVIDLVCMIRVDLTET